MIYLRNLNEGDFFRIYFDKQDPCIYRYDRYDKLRDIVWCQRFHPCGVQDIALLPTCLDVYRV